MDKNNPGKIILIAVVVLAVILLGWLIVAGRPGRAPVVQNNSVQQANKNDSGVSENIPQVVENKSDSQGQQKLSKNIPHYEEASKIESYTLQYPNSTQIQDVYRFYSSKTIDENLSYYTDWAGKNGWMVANTVKEKDVFSLYLTREQETLVAKISKDGDKVKVSLDLLKK